MNAAVTVFFLIIKVFSLYFLAVSLFGLCRRRTPEPAARLRRFAVLIAARNEESCIAGLIKSLRAQHYPLELVDIWVLPNNCTDRTAEAARRAASRDCCSARRQSSAKSRSSSGFHCGITNPPFSRPPAGGAGG